MENLKKNTYLFIVFAIILIGIIVRCYYFFTNQYLYMDDASLAMNIMHRGFFGFFETLDHVQKAPPLFMMTTWLLYKLFGMHEFTFRFVPFVASIASLFLFWKVAERYLYNKISIIFSLCLFAINSKLIYYSQSFKQYSTDVLVVLVFLYFFDKINLFELSKKKLFLISFLIAIFTLFCYPIIFVYPVIFLIYLFKNFSKENFYRLSLLSLPFAFVCLYYIFQAFALNSTQGELIHMWRDIEVCGFFSSDMQTNLSTLRSNIVYFFDSYQSFNFFNIFNDFATFESFNQFNFISLIFCILSGFFAFFFKNKTHFYLLFGIFSLTVIASILMIYPFSERAIMFLLPLILLLISKNLDYFSFKNIFSYLLPLILGVAFLNYNSQYFNNLYTQPKMPEYTLIRDTFKYITENKKDDDIFIEIQHYCLIYYYFKYFGKENTLIIRPNFPCPDEGIDERVYFEWFDLFEKGKTYWLFSFYLPYLNQIDSYTKKYLEENNIEYEEKTFGESFVYYKFKM